MTLHGIYVHTPHLVQLPYISDRGSWSRGAGRSRPKLRCFYYCANVCLNKPWAIQKTFAFFHSSKWWWIFWDEKPRVPPSYLWRPSLLLPSQSPVTLVTTWQNWNESRHRVLTPRCRKTNLFPSQLLRLVPLSPPPAHFSSSRDSHLLSTTGKCQPVSMSQ